MLLCVAIGAAKFNITSKLETAFQHIGDIWFVYSQVTIYQIFIAAFNY